MWFAVGILVSGLIFVQGQTTDYCDPKLCGGGASQHIACNNTGDFGPACQLGREIIPMTTALQNAILKKHNTYRNCVAGGNLTGFQPAVRMATIQWGNELAKLAELNVKQCELRADACRNTVNFGASGQNLALRWGVPDPTVESAINLVDDWFNKYKDATQADIDSYSDNPGRSVGTFTSMVNDRATRMGCGLLRQPRAGGIDYILTCNYAIVNIIGVPIYVKGPAASKCKTGRNPKYPNLCSTAEQINPNILPKLL